VGDYAVQWAPGQARAANPRWDTTIARLQLLLLWAVAVRTRLLARKHTGRSLLSIVFRQLNPGEAVSRIVPRRDQELRAHRREGLVWNVLTFLATGTSQY